jgi:hypothetical protein
MGPPIATPIYEKQPTMNNPVSERDLNHGIVLLQTGRRASVERARIALRSARCVEGRIKDPLDWIGVHNLADELEKAIDSFSI